MSEKISRMSRDHSEFDSMSTDELNEYLRRDADVDSDDQSDLDEILYITEVLARREAAENKHNFTDVRDSWASFQENYAVHDDDGRSLYDFGDEQPVSEIKPAPKKRRRGMRALVSTAAAVLVIFVGSITAQALGYDVWGAIASWTKDTFGYESTSRDNAVPTQYIKQIPDELSELSSAMIENGVGDGLLPSYIPAGYTASEVRCDKLSESTMISCMLSDGTNSIMLVYIAYNEPSATYSFTYEKDPGSPETFERGGVTYYLMSNTGSYFISWLSGNVECMISGIPSHDEAVKIIDSM